MLVSHGGRRAGAGRKKGSRDRRPRTRTEDHVLRTRLEQMAAQARAEAHELPVARRLNDTTLDERYRDTLAIAVAPYCSPRLTALAVVKRPAQWSDQELQQVLGLVQEDLLRIGIDRDKYPAEILNAEP